MLIIQKALPPFQIISGEIESHDKTIVNRFGALFDNLTFFGLKLWWTLISNKFCAREKRHTLIEEIVWVFKETIISVSLNFHKNLIIIEYLRIDFKTQLKKMHSTKF